MLTSDPVTAALAALATGAILGLLGALYREHREPFLSWAVVEWGATLLHLVAKLPRELDDKHLGWAFAAAVALAVGRGSGRGVTSSYACSIVYTCL